MLASDPPERQSADLPPHSLMPTHMLLRAALVTTIASRPILLKTALNFLIYLTSTKSSLLQPSKNPILHFVLKQTFYKHFCAGENGAEVTNTITKLKETGFKGVILTYAREIVIDASLEEKGKGAVEGSSGDATGREVDSCDISTWKDGVLLTVSLLGQDDFLALKLTGGGASVMSSLSSTRTVPKQMAQALDEICAAAVQRKVRILVDAEQQSIQLGIDSVALDLMRKYNQDGTDATVYNTYQAYLKSTPETLVSHIELAKSEGFVLGVKLVRGAYMASEPRKLIHDTKAETDACYDGIARGVLTQSYAPFRGESTTATSSAKSRPYSPSPSNEPFPAISLFLATHNKSSALTAHSHHSTRMFNSQSTVTSVQYGQLLGMADELSCSLLQMGPRSRSQPLPPQREQHKHDSVDKHESTTMAIGTPPPQVYKCLSWGPLQDCLSYLTRRARENQDAVSRSRDECSAIWTEVRRRAIETLLPRSLLTSTKVERVNRGG